MGEVLLVVMDLVIIFFGIMITESIHKSSKGSELLQIERVAQAAARKEEEEMLAVRTARRDSLKAAETELLAARHADSLRIAELDTLFNVVTTEIAETAVEVTEKAEVAQKAAQRAKKARNDMSAIEVKIAAANRRLDDKRKTIAEVPPKIEETQRDLRDAEAALAVTLSKRPEVVVPATSSASVATQISKGDLYSTIGLGRSFVNFGRAQFGLTASAGFGPDRSTLSGGGLFLNIPVIPNRASFDISSGAAVLTEGTGESDTSPFLAGSLRYSLREGRRLYLVTDGRVSHDRVWTGIGIGVGRR
jgi:hypothetical protein